MNHTKTKLAVLIALSLSSATLSAQQAETEAAENNEAQNLEVIEVSGYRGSLTKSLMEKRSAVNSKESIAAEDIGKFPDLNIAESIQRVPGVAISREGGEGRQITLR